MNNIYLIYGNDYGLIKKEIDKISSSFSDVVKYDLSVYKIDELLDDASCMSLFGDKKVLIGENALFLTSESTSINHDLNYLENYINDDNHENIVILYAISNKLDERKKIVKLLKEKANVIYKEEINDKNINYFVINEYKNYGYEIDFKTCKYFISIVGKNVDIILSEIKKMIIYKEDDKVITKKDIDLISSRAFNDNVFDLCDAIMKKDFKRVYACYSDLIVLKEEPIKIISNIGNQFFLTYQVKLLANKGKKESEIASILNVHPYRVKLALETDYMLYELEDILKEMYNLDYEIKSGKKDKFIAFENFLLQL